LGKCGFLRGVHSRKLVDEFYPRLSILARNASRLRRYLWRAI
jgi:hypothetical protein